VTIPAALERTGALVQPALRSAVARLVGRPRQASEYHFGWTEADGSAIDSSSGKGIRPALTVLGAEAVGADAQLAVPGAVAVELIHNFSLIHDDIIDRDETRRHRPTVWALWGIGDAIVAGEALQSLAFEHLLAQPGPGTLPAARSLATATGKMIEGQAQDIALDKAETASLEQCVEMEGNKTGALLACSAAIGATLAEAPGQAVEALHEFGWNLGVSFQAIDDLLGIWGDPAVTGKAAGNDLRETKKSMPVAMALDAGGPLASDIMRAFGGAIDDAIEDATVQRLAAQLREAGHDAQVQELARTHLDRALTALGGFDFAAGPRDELVELAHFVVDRDF